MPPIREADQEADVGEDAVTTPTGHAKPQDDELDVLHYLPVGGPPLTAAAKGSTG